jgi:hypothetical protein
MANTYRDIDTNELNDLAWKYVEHCLTSTKEVPTAKGACEIKERHLPTVRYFLYIWLRQNHFDFYTKSNWYDAMKDSNHPLSDTIKNIDETFNALATDIVANEQKGIFYAKNKLGMTDRVETKNDNTHLLSGKIIQVTSLPTDIPFANRETDVDV